MDDAEGSNTSAPDAREDAASIVESGNQRRRKKAFRFLPSNDVILLKEALKHAPWAAAHGETQSAWVSVTGGVKAAIPTCTADARACRRRFSTLVDVFKREEVESLRASEADKSEKEKRETERREAASAEIVRSAMEGMRRARARDSDTDQQTPPSTKKMKRSSTDALIGYLEDKASSRGSRDSRLEQQLHVEKRRLELEEQRLQQDREKTDKMLAMISSQMGLMAQLIEKISK
ncbi:unnamed protein product [Phytophthora fragariaefolia]|uniref:Unnamed protein product n=1 Tax=Phytophthora fragariaefolia TaxID=1490495 RepID=A0A9W6Y3B5_9STRA|nr:unnamed protein product [Phytophthora fragariaefolia]